MLLSATDQENQEKLKCELQSESKSSKLENLSAALLARLLGVPVAIAKSGFQHGGDAGPSGRQGRRFRLECKKYSDNTSLSDRELLGEIDHALARDNALEAWFLIATRNVSEQLELDITQKGERIGIPVVIIDWKDHGLASLAALCAFDPDLVEAEFSKEAGVFARALQPVSANAISMLRRDLQSWCLGFDALRTKSHEKLNKIWNSPRSSTADIGQDAAGGSESKRVRRAAVHEALNIWWQGQAQTDSPAAVIGFDGVGKTWATLDWLVENLSEQPVVLIVPSSSVAFLSGISETSVKRFLADRLYEISGVRDSEHWLRRLDYLLKRPTDEGPILTIFLDGLNQEQSVQWLPLLKVLQGETFASRVRLIISTRNHHFEDKLSNLRGLIAPAIRVAVDIYDTAPGGELDQMLAFDGLTQADLHSDLIELARTPRLFKLVVRFRNRLVEAGQVTVHRLLWEYGRDTLGVRAGKSFSENEWRAWLKEIAQKYRDGVRNFSVKSLGETASRPDLSESEVYARLSDIIDGQFVKSDHSGSLHLTPTVIAHSLGAALLAHLETVVTPNFTTLNTELMQWLDPIAGLDQRAEILRAAVSILVEQDNHTAPPVAGVLVTAWLQTQNVTDNHRQELAILAPNLANALLDAVEQSNSHTHTSARLWAVNALRAIPRTDIAALTIIVSRVRQWFCIVSRDVDPRPDANADSEKHRSNRFKNRIGIDSSGSITVVGVELELIDRADGILQATAPSIIEGFPLANAIPIFEVVAITLAVRCSCDGWDALKWLCLLNEVDPVETTAALRSMSEAVRHRRPEPGVNSDIPARVAALLLWLTGQEQDDDTAVSINPNFDRCPAYEKDYLAQPGHSFYALERQHAEIVLNDTELRLLWRIQRTRELWLDPSFQPTPAFATEVRAVVAHIEVDKLNRHGSHTIEDHDFEELEPVLARCAPDLLADMIRRKMQSATTCPLDSRYWCAIHVTDHLLLAGEREAAAARALRLSGTDTNESQESYAANQLLMVELQHLDTLDQFKALIGANIKSILTSLAEVLRPPTSDDVDSLIALYATGSPKQQDDLFILLSIHPVKFSDSAWAWLMSFAQQPAHKLCHIAFKTLNHSDATRFGRTLAADNWHWNPDKHFWINHYGTDALIEATQALPFDQVVPRLAPWRLLEAARLRGADPDEVRLAAEILGHVLLAEKIDEPDPGSILSFDQNDAKSSPFSFSASPHPSQANANDPAASLKEFMDVDARVKAHQRAAETAISRISETRASGASLYLTNLDTADFDLVVRYALDIVVRWLEGAHELTTDFRRRVHLAEGAFLALCEALLSHDPIRGADLWRALRATVTTRYLGEAYVEDILHMLFRAPDSPAVIALREEVIELRNSNTDQALFDLAVAAVHNGKVDWLTSVIETDRISPLVWKRKRGVVLAGFIANNMLPIADAWPNGEIKTGHAALDIRSARFRWIEACAHHWWQIYLTTQDPDEAYAAWVLFFHSADPRAWTWMRKDIQTANDTSSFFNLKLSHAQLNRSKLKRVMEKRTEKLDKKLFNRDTIDGVGPWGTVPD